MSIQPRHLILKLVLGADDETLSVRAAIGDAQRRSAYAFVIPASDGQVLVEAEIAPGDLAAARERWRSRTAGWVLVVLGLTMLLYTAPLLDARRRARATAPLVAATGGLVAVLLTARYVLRLAAVRLVEGDAAGPFDLLLWALLLVAMVWLAADLVERRRVVSPRFRLHGGTRIRIALAYAGAGALAASLIWAYDRFLQNIVSRTPFDLLHFSLHPLSTPRLAIGFGLILLHAGRGGGLSDMFGGGSLGGSMAGATTVEKNLDRITVIVSLVFVFTTILLGLRVS